LKTPLSWVRNNRLRPDLLFESDQLRVDLVGRSVRSGAVTISGQIALLVVMTAQTMLLARILAPEDFGLIAMVAVVVGLANMLKEAGLQSATVQQSEISRDQVTVLFWANVGLSVVITVVLAAVSPLLAAFYRSPQLVGITLGLSVSFLCGGLSLQHAALLQRHMKFGAIAAAAVFAQITGLAVSLVMGLRGAGYWALVGGALGAALASTAMTFYLCPWMPGRPRKTAGVGRMLGFGGYLTAFNFMNYFARNGDNVLIGWRFGATELGFYSKAYNLMMLPISQVSSPLSSVAVPALSRLSGDHGLMGRYYLKTLRLLSMIASPIGAVCFALSNEIIMIMLGPRWGPAIAPFRLLCIGGVFQPLYFTQAWLHVATGNARRVFRWGLVATPVILGSFVIGMIWGVNGVAAGYSAAIVILVGPALGYGASSAGLKFVEIVRAVRWPLIACTIAAGLTTLIVQVPAAGWPLLARGIVGLAVFGVSYVLLLIKGFRDMRASEEIAAVLRHLRSGVATADDYSSD